MSSIRIKNRLKKEKNICETITDNVRWAYTKSPFNLSTFTGYRHPHISRLKGNPLFGSYSTFSHHRGLYICDEIIKVGDIAKQDPRGMCYWWIVHEFFMLVTHPSDFEQIFLWNKDKISRAELVKDNLAVVHGSSNILTAPPNKEWHIKRTVGKSRVFSEEALSNLVEPLQKIIDGHFSEALNTTVNLRNFTNRLTLDVIAKTQLGMESLAQSEEKLTAAYEHAFTESMAYENIGKQRWVNFRDRLMERTEPTPLEQTKAKLRKVIRDEVLNLYEEKIRSSDNLLTAIAHEMKEQPINFNSEKVLSDLGLFLLAGHDTTARLLEHAIMLLETHPVIFEKLKIEIEKNKPKSSKWTKEDVYNVPYVLMILKETLRLYPPVPLVGVKVTKKFSVGNISRVNNTQEYENAMKKRDKTQDVIYEPGDTIFISPFITQRWEKYFENPLEFNPERFSNDNTKNNGAWFPFILGQRDCIGQRFALLEASLVLITLVEKYDFKMKEKLTHEKPFAETMIGIMKPKDPVNVIFEKVESKNMTYKR